MSRPARPLVMGTHAVPPSASAVRYECTASVTLGVSSDRTRTPPSSPGTVNGSRGLGSPYAYAGPVQSNVTKACPALKSCAVGCAVSGSTPHTRPAPSTWRGYSRSLTNRPARSTNTRRSPEPPPGGPAGPVGPAGPRGPSGPVGPAGPRAPSDPSLPEDEVQALDASSAIRAKRIMLPSRTSDARQPREEGENPPRGAALGELLAGLD